MRTIVKMKPEFVKAIIDNPTLLCQIAEDNHKSISTIERWCSLNDTRLTMVPVVNRVKEFLKLKSGVEVTENVVAKKAA